MASGQEEAALFPLAPKLWPKLCRSQGWRGSLMMRQEGQGLPRRLKRSCLGPWLQVVQGQWEWGQQRTLLVLSWLQTQKLLEHHPSVLWGEQSITAHMLPACSSETHSPDWKLEIAGKVRASSWARGRSASCGYQPLLSQVFSSPLGSLKSLFHIHQCSDVYISLWFSMEIDQVTSLL